MKTKMNVLQKCGKLYSKADGYVKKHTLFSLNFLVFIGILFICFVALALSGIFPRIFAAVDILEAEIHAFCADYHVAVTLLELLFLFLFKFVSSLGFSNMDMGDLICFVFAGVLCIAGNVVIYFCVEGFNHRFVLASIALTVFCAIAMEWLEDKINF